MESDLRKMASYAMRWQQNERDAHWPALGHAEPQGVEPPADTVTFAGLIHNEGVRHSDCLQMEIHRLRALTRDLEHARNCALQHQACAVKDATRCREALSSLVTRLDGVTLRASVQERTFEKQAEEIALLREQLAAADEEIAELKKTPANSSRFDGGLARKNRQLGAQLAEVTKSLENATRRAIAAEGTVQHQKNGIDALNADFCALELKYVALKQDARKPVMPPLPLMPPPPHDDDVFKVGSPEEDGWERVKLPFSEA